MLPYLKALAFAPEVLLCIAIYAGYTAYWAITLMAVSRTTEGEAADAPSQRGRDALIILGVAYLFGVMSVATGVFVETGMDTLAAISGSWFTAAMVLGLWALAKVRRAALGGERRRPLRIALALAAFPVAATPAAVVGIFIWAAYL